MTAAHILVCLTEECKGIKDIAKDFDNNLELVTVWIDYMKSIRSVYMPLFPNFARNVKRRNIFN